MYKPREPVWWQTIQGRGCIFWCQSGFLSGLATQFNPCHHLSPDVITKAAEAIIKAVEREAFKEEFDAIVQRTNNYEGRDGARARKRSQKKSNLYQLDPLRR